MSENVITKETLERDDIVSRVLCGMFVHLGVGNDARDVPSKTLGSSPVDNVELAVRPKAREKDVADTFVRTNTRLRTLLFPLPCDAFV